MPPWPSRRKVNCPSRDAARWTVFWNGPLGVFEKPPFDAGTLAVARALADSPAFTVIGGGETVAAARRAGVLEQLGHVSTGGGASLALLAGKTLPGVAVLIWLALRRWWAPVRGAPRHWLAGIFLALITHPLLDAHTAYGTQLLWPFEPVPVAGISHVMSGVRPSMRWTSTVMPSMWRPRAQVDNRSVARSMYPCAAQSGSKAGLLFGIAM